MLFDWLKKRNVKKDIIETDKDKELFVQMEAAYGEQRALNIVKQVKEFKDRNPGKTFSFIFDELGNFLAIDKSKDKEE